MFPYTTKKNNVYAISVSEIVKLKSSFRARWFILAFDIRLAITETVPRHGAIPSTGVKEARILTRVSCREKNLFTFVQCTNRDLHTDESVRRQFAEVPASWDIKHYSHTAYFQARYGRLSS